MSPHDIVDVHIRTSISCKVVDEMRSKTITTATSVALPVALTVGFIVSLAPPGHAAPAPNRLVPTPAGITFPPLAAVARNHTDCQMGYSCPNRLITGGSSDNPATFGVFSAEAARFRKNRSARLAMEYRWDEVQNSVRSGLLINDYAEISSGRGYQVIRLNAELSVSRGYWVRSVLVRKDHKIVQLGGIQANWRADGSLGKLVKKAKKKVDKDFSRLTITTPRPT